MATRPGPTPPEVGAHERRLHRAAAARAVDPVDGELADVLSAVRDRRARRAGAVPFAAAAAGASPGEVVAVEDVGPEVRILRVGRPAGFAFEAGQYVKAGVSGGPRRSFSLASAPHDEHLELCVELRPGGEVTPALFRLRVGEHLEIDDRPRGRFALGAAAVHLFVGTVTGIAPLRSLVRHALHRGVPGRLVVLHGASHADELPYLDELTALVASEPRVRYEPTVSRPGDARNASWTGRTGRVDDLALAEAATLDPAATQVYAAGNPGMVARVAAELGGRGFAVVTEAYD